MGRWFFAGMVGLLLAATIPGMMNPSMGDGGRQIGLGLILVGLVLLRRIFRRYINR